MRRQFSTQLCWNRGLYVDTFLLKKTHWKFWTAWGLSIHGNWFISSTNQVDRVRSNCWPFEIRARYPQLGQPHFLKRAATHNFFLENLLADAIGIPTVYFQGKVSREDLKMCYSVLHWCKSWLPALHNSNNSTWPCVCSWSATGFDETLTLHGLLIKSKEE